MIAAGHIGTTSAASTLNSAKNGARNDASSQSFSASLGEATQSAQSRVQSEHASQNSNKRGKDADNDPKLHSKRDQASSTVDTTPLQQTDEAAPNAHALTLPINLSAPAASDESAEEETSSKEEIQSTASALGPSVQTASWSGLAGSTSWITQSQSLGANGSDDSLEAPVAPGSQDGSGETPVVQGAAGDSRPNEATLDARRQGGPSDQQDSTASLTSVNPLQDTGYAANSAATAAQVIAASGQNLIPANLNVKPGTSGIDLAGIVSGKASSTLKGLQNVTASGSVTSSLTNNSVPGAKETDSYLSIQKQTKNDSGITKDAAAPAIQHATRNDATQEAFVTPVLTAAQAHTTVSSQSQQQASNANIEGTPSAAGAAAQDASLSSQLDHAVTTSQTPTSDVTAAVVNSAKLIQSIGQSEMRVGVRTADFGDISIRTSSTRDSISAQISLGHDDLAKTLTAHLPEMQTRLTSGEVVDVHIHSDHQAGSFSDGQSAASNGGAQNQQQDSESGRSTFFNGYSSSQPAAPTVPASVIASSVASSGRLDIRA